MPRTDVKQGDIITPIPFDGPNKDYYEVTSIDPDTKDFWVAPAGMARLQPPIQWDLNQRFRFVKNSDYVEPGVIKDDHQNPTSEGGKKPDNQ